MVSGSVSADRDADSTPWDVGAEIDAGPWRGRQRAVLLAVGCAITFDGFDNQALGLAAPAIIRDWGISRALLAPILALSQVGMMFGTAIGGIAGDRFGRRTALIGSVLLFGCATLLMAAARDLTMLGVLRVLAGLGLGGALPNAAALVSEYTPSRHRSLAVAASIVCVPLGGVLGGLIAARLLPVAGWRALFLCAGVLPLVLAAALALRLPESARFLLARGGDRPLVRQMLRRAGIEVPAGFVLVDRAETVAGGGGVAALVAPGLRRETIALWAAFGFCLVAIYTGFNWLPTMLADAGFDLARSSIGLTAFNLGGVVAALGGAASIGRLGSRWPMTIMAVMGATGAAAVALVPLGPATSTLALVLMFGLLGGFVNGVQTMLYALAAYIYPVRLRASGVGAASGVGRIGAISSSFLGAFLLGRLGAPGFFVLVGAAMTATTVALFLIRRHVPPAGRALT